MMREKRKTVFFRADGSSKMGLGHVVRSLALAQMLKADFHCIFASRGPVDSLQQQILNVADQFLSLEDIDPLEEVEMLITRYLTGEEIVVLDGYHFTTSYQTVLKEKGCKVVCIDDIHAYHFTADAVLNHAGGVNRMDYSAEKETVFLLGPAYALLRPAFLAEPKPLEKPLVFRSVFVCMGGADPRNMSEAVGRALVKLPEMRQIEMVIGRANNYRDRIEEWAAAYTQVKLHFDLTADEMAALIRSCDFAIAPASGIAYEICAVGTPLSVGKYVDNQEFLYKYLVDNELAVGLGNFEDETLWRQLPDPVRFEVVAVKQREVFDGRAGKRLRTFFLGLALEMRKADEGDVRLYFDWVNEPEVRRNSLNTNPVLWENHIQWFQKHVADSVAHTFYIFELAGEPVGQVRFDLAGGHAVINYSVDNTFRGIGIGGTLLEKAIEALRTDRPEMERISGVVKKENQASRAIFLKLGFEESEKDEFLFEYFLAI